VDGLASQLRERGIRARGHVRFGLPVEEILKFAATEGNDLIAMTTHGRTGMSRWVSGSVTEQVMRSTPVPLLVQKAFADVLEGAPASPLRRILVPLDGTVESEQAVPLAMEVARAGGAELVLVSVVSFVDRTEVPAAERITATYLRNVCARLERRGLNARPMVRRGTPAVEIHAAIDEERPELVAVATRGRVGVSRWVLGSVVERVLRSVTTPMLVRRIVPGGAGAVA
jgi:nucleotide-binding universal stress UspA family protein